MRAADLPLDGVRPAVQAVEHAHPADRSKCGLADRLARDGGTPRGWSLHPEETSDKPDPALLKTAPSVRGE
jgi:hypothetical protein